MFIYSKKEMKKGAILVDMAAKPEIDPDMEQAWQRMKLQIKAKKIRERRDVMDKIFSVVRLREGVSYDRLSVVQGQMSIGELVLKRGTGRAVLEIFKEHAENVSVVHRDDGTDIDEEGE